jgi:nicotinate phosphoribosyltransferase
MTSDRERLRRLTDTYFLRTKEIVRRYGDREATYALFMRRPVICTPRLMVDFLEAEARARGTSFAIELSYEEGGWVGAGEPMVYLTGSLHHLVDLETLYLQKLGAPCVAAYNAYAMCVDLPRAAFLAMDARHCAGAEMAEMMSARSASSATPPTRPRIISATRRGGAPCRTRSSAMPARRCARPRCSTRPFPTRC